MFWTQDDPEFFLREAQIKILRYTDPSKFAVIRLLIPNYN